MSSKILKNCGKCGTVDVNDDESVNANHEDSIRHISNEQLESFDKCKSQLYSTNSQLIILIEAVGKKTTSGRNIEVIEKPNQEVIFKFSICNISNRDVSLMEVTLLDVLLKLFELKKPQVPYTIKSNDTMLELVCVTFKSKDIGQFNMPIAFTFQNADEAEILVMREMVVNVQDVPMATTTSKEKSPYAKFTWNPEDIIEPVTERKCPEEYQVPELVKKIVLTDFNEENLYKLTVITEEMEKLHTTFLNIREIFNEGRTLKNYTEYFHYLLYLDEIERDTNFEKYKMREVPIERAANHNTYNLHVPGVSRKRPAVLPGNKVLVQFCYSNSAYICVVASVNGDKINLSSMAKSFHVEQATMPTVNVKFLADRSVMESMHYAVDNVFKQKYRVFPEVNPKIPPVKSVNNFYNNAIKFDKKQISAVQHIVAKTSGKAPYIVLGPPGTGKTATIVEAIIQVVMANVENRVLVCTDSNMAADHIASKLVDFNKELKIKNFIIRANAASRDWNALPSELLDFSSGSFKTKHKYLTSDKASEYRIMVTTLIHAVQYAKEETQKMSHLFIDEAGQASEPATLVPIVSLLAPDGQLVLAGDPKQLGPVCVSDEAKKQGLGISLLESLWQDFHDLYRTENSNYITTLFTNYRSNPDILKISNELFYDNMLEFQAPADPISTASVLGGQKAIVFHAVNSKEQNDAKVPGYYNNKELEKLMEYVRALVHSTDPPVSPKDIGIISPYKTQEKKIEQCLKNNGFAEIVTGTVESFQGKDKRVILISTVRANNEVLDWDAKYRLGFLTEDKRFNVMMSRANSKLIVIGNPACLRKDVKWQKYMDLCKEYGTYFGEESQQSERTPQLHKELTQTTFNKCGITKIIEKGKKK